MAQSQNTAAAGRGRDLQGLEEEEDKALLEMELGMVAQLKEYAAVVNAYKKRAQVLLDLGSKIAETRKKLEAKKKLHSQADVERITVSYFNKMEEYNEEKHSFKIYLQHMMNKFSLDPKKILYQG